MRPVRCSPRTAYSTCVLALSLVLLLVTLLSVMGCAPGADAASDAADAERLVLASTTSTEDSGLFEELVPAFEESHPGYRVEVVAMGTGAALELGRNGDADVLLVHAKPDEVAFVEEGYGAERRDVMYNDFVILGPPSDPAGVSEAGTAAEALRAVAEAGAGFVSRGDDSGTHRKELAVWESAGVEASGDWHVDAGQGMGDVLTMASEREAYTMSDRATFLSMRDRLDLVVLFDGDEALFNQYGVIRVSAATNPEGAEAFADWIVSDDAQRLIGGYGLEEYGEPLFVPNA